MLAHKLHALHGKHRRIDRASAVFGIGTRMAALSVEYDLIALKTEAYALSRGFAARMIPEHTVKLGKASTLDHFDLSAKATLFGRSSVNYESKRFCRIGVFLDRNRSAYCRRAL